MFPILILEKLTIFQMNRSSIVVVALVAALLINIVSAEIVCNDQGYCSGDGAPHEDVRCGSKYFLKPFSLSLLLVK